MTSQLQDWGSIGDVPGVRVGHVGREGDGWLSGVTVVIPPPGTVGSVDVRGGGPGTHETDALHPTTLVPTVDAVVLTGGSAFGLASAGGVQRWLVEQGMGYPAGPPEDRSSILVPIVPAAAILDLGRGGDINARPDADMGYQAAAAATENATGHGLSGFQGAGTGARMAALTLRGGVGTASLTLTSPIPQIMVPDGVVVGAIAVVNAFGSPFSPSGRPYAEPFLPEGFESFRAPEPPKPGQPPPRANTTLVVVATNARLDPAQCYRTAVSAHDGIARALVPAHTMLDGDTAFTLATGETALDPLAVVLLQALAAQVTLLAIADLARRTVPLTH